MNLELIEDIAEQCWEDSEGESIIRLDYRKFAELIIKECIDVINTEEYNTTALTSFPQKSSAIWNANHKIKSHFGLM